jgi:hypothetical protein
MNEYQFTLILSEPEQSEDDVDELYSRFNDGSLITSAGVTRIEFDREAPSLREAILSAIDDVEKTRFRVARVESDQDRRVTADINAELVAGRR